MMQACSLKYKLQNDDVSLLALLPHMQECVHSGRGCHAVAACCSKLGKAGRLDLQLSKPHVSPPLDLAIAGKGAAQPRKVCLSLPPALLHPYLLVSEAMLASVFTAWLAYHMLAKCTCWMTCSSSYTVLGLLFWSLLAALARPAMQEEVAPYVPNPKLLQ
eukprot:scaffold169332_cov17-Tisochrysis_lutea.AAC.1